MPRASGTLSASDQALAKGWDLYQLDGFWYVNRAMGARRQPMSHQQPPSAQEIGAGSSPANAMDAARAGDDRSEADRTDDPLTERSPAPSKE